MSVGMLTPKQKATKTPYKQYKLNSTKRGGHNKW